MRRLIRSAGVCLLVLASLAFAPLATPGPALADDASVSTCDEASFDAALATVQGSGGGTLALDCTGTITFSGEKTIMSDVTITGNGVIFDGGAATRLFNVEAGARLALAGLVLQNGSANTGGAIVNQGTLDIIATTIVGNTVTGGGGAIQNLGVLNLTASNVISNSASGNAGAIVNAESATATIVATLFATNSAGSSGGAIRSEGQLDIASSSFFVNMAGDSGGALVNNIGGIMTVDDSTFVTNSASVNGGAIANNGTLELTTSTFFSNSAQSRGGALRNGGDITAIGNSFSFNGSPDGGVIRNAGTATFSGSVLSANTLPNCSRTVTSGGSNLSDDTSCGFDGDGDLQGSTNVNLDGLMDNGGPTLTMLPLADALDSADCAATTALDQRGAERPDDDCDKGAAEAGATVPVQIFAFVNLSGPIDAGESATLRIIAYGPDNTNLDFAVDCNNDEVYESPGIVDSAGTLADAECNLVEGGVQQVNVQVCDGGDASNCATDTTTVTVNAELPPVEPSALCASRYTGQLSAMPASGGCPSGSVTLSFPTSTPVTFCVNPYTGALVWSPRGTCGAGYRVHIVPDNGPLNYCQNIYTGRLTYSATGACGAGERPGVIGVISG